ncbi:MAG: hypothetical protein ACRDRA_03255 [Pseudonocardiaceae bacterium]
MVVHRSSPLNRAAADQRHELDGACHHFLLTPGHLDVRATVHCPDGGDHEHHIVTACHTAVVDNIVIIED